MRKNIVVDISQIDKSLEGDADYDKLEELDSDGNNSGREPIGLIYNPRPTKNRAISQHERSDMSDTIEEIQGFGKK